MTKQPTLKSILKYILISGGVLAILKFCFSSISDTIDEPQEINFLFIQWITYAIVLILIVVYVLNFVLNKLLPWKKFTGIRFISQLLLGTLLSLGSINLAYLFIKNEFTSSSADWGQIILLNIYGAGMILPVFSVFFGYKFLKAWRKSEIESERLSKENTKSQLLSLRNHLDPHFLFNNLNILSSLMDKDTELSKDYLNKFAEVYRVILKTEYSDLTTLEEELQLIESYVFLIKIRFDKSVFFDFKISESAKKMALPPLSIQMLIENAIKHNVATRAKPVTLSIYDKEGILIVENNIQKKKYLPQEREATGLKNIQKRYEFFTDKKMTVEETSSHFRVSLPLIPIDYE